MTVAQPETVGESRRYWTHGVETFPSPVAQFRMAQLIDMDDRLYETARVVYRFMVGWYHDGYGDALLSQRHVAKVMKQRAPAGAVVPSRNAVQRAILALMETGWVVRSFQGRGKGKGASRYVPVMNVLELAAQGKFPEPAHATGPVEPAHANGPLVARANGPVEAEPAHATGPKTLPPDSATEPKTGGEEYDFAPPAPALAGGAAAKEGFDELYAAYGVKKDKAAARQAYDKLAPDADLHARMVDAAQAWRQAAGSIDRMRLRRWIEEERYDEDPKGKRDGKRADHADTPPAKPKPAGGEPFVERRETLTVISASISDDEDREGVRWLDLIFRREEDGNEDLGESFVVESPDPDRQEDGQKSLAAFFERLGMDVPEDADEIVGLTFTRTLRSKFGSWEYAPVADNDNTPDGIRYVDDWQPAPSEPKRPPGGFFKAVVAAHPLEFHPQSFAAALATEDDDDEEAA
ncbi:MAG: hypothetical protein M9945_05105 [Aquamicrobium sp.]|uniref:hypothetical protein n=1 Tax=Aquamicrobium sp. TaxID=1872579 RepID=UPI00349ED608|nr:hypothetical protein [Aquamicrobium sp.]